MNALDQTIAQLANAQQQLLTVRNNKSLPMDVRIAAATEYAEVSHRLLIVLGKQLAKDVADLKPLSDKVKQAYSELTEVLGNIEKAEEVVKSTTKFLEVVDDLIDTAKPFLKFMA